jgi:uncharacterized membrane protein
MRQTLFVAHLAVIAIFHGTAAGQASTPYTFTEIAFPGATHTIPLGMNEAGAIVGTYSYDDLTAHGFVLSGGTFESIDFPGACSGIFCGTEAVGINSQGQIVGQYYSCGVPNGYGCRHSFLWDDGVFTVLPDAPASMAGTTAASAINTTGQIVGYYVDPCFCTIHGFSFSDGVYTTIDRPGFSATALHGLNDSGSMVGTSAECWGCGTSSGFSVTGGSFVEIQVASSATSAAGINGLGDVAGRYLTDSYHAFVIRGGTLTLIDHPEAVHQTAIWGQAIDSSGRVVGTYIPADGVHHGFLATPTVSIDVCLLYDPTKAVKSGSTIPIKLQLCTTQGQNISSADVVVHAINITVVSDDTSGEVEDAGNANPDNDFRYDADLGGTGGYIFNLSTRGLTRGSYKLNFRSSSDTTVLSAPFQVR